MWLRSVRPHGPTLFHCNVSSLSLSLPLSSSLYLPPSSSLYLSLSLQENIQLAKKDWELSHLQNLRAEEERLAEEEAEDVLLTYDRPETANKVILRRRLSTGTWEILCPSPEPSSPPQPPSFSSSRGVADGSSRKTRKDRGSRRGSSRLRQMQRGVREEVSEGREAEFGLATPLASDASSPALSPKSAQTAGSGSVVEHLNTATDKEESPLPLANHCEQRRPHVELELAGTGTQRLGTGGAGGGRDGDGDGDGKTVGEYARSVETSINRGTIKPSTPLSWGPEDLKSKPKRTGEISPGVSVKSEPKSPPCLSTSSQDPPLSPPPSTNHISDDCISSRTRHRTSHSSSEVEKSPNHKYPTRLRLQHAASVS